MNIELYEYDLDIVDMMALETQFKHTLCKSEEQLHLLTEYKLGQTYMKIMNKVKAENEQFGIDELMVIKSRIL